MASAKEAGSATPTGSGVRVWVLPGLGLSRLGERQRRCDEAEVVAAGLVAEFTGLRVGRACALHVDRPAFAALQEVAEVGAADGVLALAGRPEAGACFDEVDRGPDATLQGHAGLRAALRVARGAVLLPQGPCPVGIRGAADALVQHYAQGRAATAQFACHAVHPTRALGIRRHPRALQVDLPEGSASLASPAAQSAR